MPDKSIASLFTLGNRFLRSANLDRDFQDPGALSGYVLTDFARTCLTRVASGLKPGSSQRAWRMTGDYGCGKSSFALLLAHALSAHGARLPPHLRAAVTSAPIAAQTARLIPVLVTCSRQPLGLSILKALLVAEDRAYGNVTKSKSAIEIRRLLSDGTEPTEDQIFQIVLNANAQIAEDRKGTGLLLIIDELGKFLEFAAMHPQRQDVFLLQRLAEAASRSGSKPLFVVSLLHQGFNAYADNLNQSAQREWEKVAGRFEEIVFNQPVEEVANLVASALNVKTQQIPKSLAQRLKLSMQKTQDLGWFGAGQGKALSHLAVRLYPLHPTVIPVLVRTFRRFGQNERSLFSFLLSNEPFGLQVFSAKRAYDSEPYRLHNFYDYVRANFGHRLAGQSYRSHWNLIDSTIDSFATEDETEVNLLKTVGMLNLLNDGDLLPTKESVTLALDAMAAGTRTSIEAAIEKLHHGKRILYDRGRARGLCLWPHTSVDLERAYEDAYRAVDAPRQVATAIKDLLEPRPIVARRHYIETGNLRHFEVRYCPMAELSETQIKAPPTSDGLIIVPLCETAGDREVAIRFAKNDRLENESNCLIAIPKELGSLATLIQEVQRWDWIFANTPELNADKFAREEVSRQRAAADLQLQRRVQSCIGLKQSSGKLSLEWFQKGRPITVNDGRDLLHQLSEILDATYSLAPRVHNELINRRSLSSAAAAARMRLMERMFTYANSELLGMAPEKKPPEMSIYLSLLRNTGIHQKHGEKWAIGEPDSGTDEKCRIRPALQLIRKMIQDQPDSRVNIAALFAELRKPPYGCRDGIIPILLTAFAIAHQRDVAFYKDGTFLRELGAEAMLVLTKAPEKFDIQYCKIDGVRAEVFEKLLTVLEVKAEPEREAELLDVVRSLCAFVARLPAYALNTKTLPANALAVRGAILNAREPTKLLFKELPEACGFLPITPHAKSGKPALAFTDVLKTAIDDLRAAFPELQERLRKRLRDAFDIPGNFQQFRNTLAMRAETAVLGISEPKLRAFCLRLMDDNLPESDWLESLGSFLALKPPSKWHDTDEEIFGAELAQCAARFYHVESIAFAKNGAPAHSVGVRLAITQASGAEHEQVVYFTADEEPQLRSLQREFEAFLARDRRLGLAAASRAIWKSLDKEAVAKHE
jgi:hypothetical protein